MDEIQLHNEQPPITKFSPGRKPLHDITKLRKAADESGQWVSQVVSLNAANSFRRQFKKLGDYHVSVSRVDDYTKRQVIVKRKEK